MDWVKVRKACIITDKIQLGEKNSCRVEEFKVGPQAAELERIRSMFSFSSRSRGVPEGKYTRLVKEGRGVMMSDTPDELNDCYQILHEARGRVLINGLGLGCVLNGILAKEEVEHVDIVEVDKDIIDLVGPNFIDPFGNLFDERVEIHLGDAFTYEWLKGTRWNAAWHDVWDELCEDNLSNEEYATPGTYAKLHRKYGRKSNWQGSWGFEYLKAQRSQNRSRW